MVIASESGKKLFESGLHTVIIEEAKKVHGNFYSYDKFEYIQSKQSSIITCPKHGDFLQCPQKHLLGQGCPKCSSSKLETLIINILNKNNIYFKYQSKVINLGDRSVDFYLPEYKIIIECQGDQHFKPVRFNNNDSDNDLEEKFHKQLIIDRDKYEAALKEGYDIIYFTSYDIIHDDVDIEIPFYDGKKLFLNPEQLVNYISTKSKQKVLNLLTKLNFFSIICCTLVILLLCLFVAASIKCFFASTTTKD